jgi:hypothetical protein
MAPKNFRRSYPRTEPVEASIVPGKSMQNRVDQRIFQSNQSPLIFKTGGRQISIQASRSRSPYCNEIVMMDGSEPVKLDTHQSR